MPALLQSFLRLLFNGADLSFISPVGLHHALFGVRRLWSNYVIHLPNDE